MAPQGRLGLGQSLWLGGGGHVLTKGPCLSPCPEEDGNISLQDSDRAHASRQLCLRQSGVHGPLGIGISNRECHPLSLGYVIGDSEGWG